MCLARVYAAGAALVKQHHCEFVMLDECLSSLDEVNRANCLHVIREHLFDKLVLIVDHEIAESCYDDEFLIEH